MSDCSKASYQRDGYPYYFSKCYWQKEKLEISPMPISKKSTKGHPDTGKSLSFKEKLQMDKLEYDRKKYQEAVEFGKKVISQSKYTEPELKKTLEKWAKNGLTSRSISKNEYRYYYYDNTSINPDTKKEESTICGPLKEYYHYMKNNYSKDLTDCLQYEEKYLRNSYSGKKHFTCTINADWSK